MRGRYWSKWGTHDGFVNVNLRVDEESVESGGRREMGRRKGFESLKWKKGFASNRQQMTCKCKLFGKYEKSPRWKRNWILPKSIDTRKVCNTVLLFKNVT